MLERLLKSSTPKWALTVALLLVLLASDLPCRGQGIAPEFCASTHIPLIFPPEISQVAGREHGFAAREYAAGDFALTNLSNKSIKDLEVLVAYEDRNGHVLLTIPYRAALDMLVRGRYFGIHTEFVEHLSAPLLPGGVLHLTGISQLTTTRCPVLGRVSFVHLLYFNDQTYVYASPGWLLEAAIEDMSESLSAPASVADEAPMLPFHIKIDSKGRVFALEALDPASDNAVLWLGPQVRKWTYNPAIREGDPCASELRIIIGFHLLGLNNNFPVPEYEDKAHGPFALVDLEEDQFHPGRWTITYGGRLSMDDLKGEKRDRKSPAFALLPPLP